RLRANVRSGIADAATAVAVLRARSARAVAHRRAESAALGILRLIADQRAAAGAGAGVAGFTGRTAIAGRRIDLALIAGADVRAAFGVGRARIAFDVALGAAADAAIAGQRAAVERFAARDSVGAAGIETFHQAGAGFGLAAAAAAVVVGGVARRAGRIACAG